MTQIEEDKYERTICASDGISCKSGVMDIDLKWEDMMISIPLNVGDFREAVIYKSLREIKREIKTLQTQVESLRDTTIKYKFRDISGEEARKEITSYLELKPKDDKSLTIFSISQELEISADIVEDVLESLQVEGKLKLN